MPSILWDHLKRIFEGRVSNIPEAMKEQFAIIASHCFWNSQFTGFHLSPRSSLLFFLYSFSYERSYAPEGDAKNRLIQYLADTPVVIGFRPHSQRFLDFMRHSFTHVFVRSHIDPNIHFKDYIWDSRDSLAMQEIVSMAGFRIRAQIGELMLAANSLQQSDSLCYRDYHMFIPKTWKTLLDRFMGDQEIPKSFIERGCDSALVELGVRFWPGTDLDAFIPHWICIGSLCSLDIAILPGSICHLFVIQFAAFVWRYSCNISVDDSLLWFRFIHDNTTLRGRFLVILEAILLEYILPVIRVHNTFNHLSFCISQHCIYFGDD